LLDFLYAIYLLPEDKTKTINNCEDLYRSILVPDLLRWEQHIDKLVDVSRKGHYENVLCEEAKRRKRQNLRLEINS
jgi:hypothetical protein